MWNSIRADEFCESVRDGTHDTPKQQSFGYKLVTSKHIQDGLIQPDDAYYISEDDYKKINERSKVEKWDVLMAMIGNGLGRSAIVESNPDYAIKNIALFKMGGNEVKAKWLHYFLSTNYTQQVIINYLQGTGQPFLSLSLLRKFKVPNPPLTTQQKIASILSAYDNLIQNYKKQIEALQIAASELYKEWFVRFRFPGWQTTEFENGIPKGWKVERLGNLAEIKSGKRLPQGYDFSDYPTSHPYIRARDIKHGNIDSNDFAYISDDVYQKLKRYIVDENDILLTIVANIGDVGYVNKSLQGFNLTENAVRLTNYSERIEPRYLCYYLTQPATKIYMEGLAVGAAQAKLGIYKIETIKVLLPNINIQKVFSRRITLIHTKIDNLNKQITNLTQQRDLLLPRLMSGKLEVE